jgi:hypothetical protein
VIPAIGELATMLRCHRYAHNNEKQLQDGIECVFRLKQVEFEREFSLSAADRPDFMVGDIAVEVKIKGSRHDVLRQIFRYAEHVTVAGIVVVSTKACHRGLPEKLNGKPVVMVSLMEGSF